MRGRRVTFSTSLRIYEKCDFEQPSNGFAIFFDFRRAVGTCCVFRSVGEAPVLQGSSVQLKFISSTRFQVEVGGWRLELGVGGWRLEVGVPTPTR